MGYDISKVRELAAGSGLVKNPEVSFLADGFGNYNFLIRESDVKLVLRLRKKCEGQFNDSLERENSFLRYFESKGIDFCPKVVYYDKEKNFLIEKFIEGEMVSQKDFSNAQIDLFAKQLFRLFSLSVPDFFDFCESHSLKKFDYTSMIDSLEMYGFKRFEEAKKDGIPEDVSSWIKGRLDKNYEYLSRLDVSDEELGFHWGDIQSDVFIDSSGNMTFYDFEHAEIYPSPGLSYIKIHGKFSDSQFDYLLKRYSHYSGEDRKKLIENIVHEERVTRVNDVVWAAMTWVKNGKDEFKDLMYKRMKLAEKLD